jgi:hypothetical protein
MAKIKAQNQSNVKDGMLMQFSAIARIQNQHKSQSQNQHT